MGLTNKRRKRTKAEKRERAAKAAVTNWLATIGTELALAELERTRGKEAVEAAVAWATHGR